MYEYMYECMYKYMNICMLICMDVCTHVCVCMCLHIHTHIYIYIYIYKYSYKNMYVRVHLVTVDGVVVDVGTDTLVAAVVTPDNTLFPSEEDEEGVLALLDEKSPYLLPNFWLTDGFL